MNGRFAVGLSAFCIAVSSGCVSAVAELHQASLAYDEARFESAREWLVEIEPSAPSFEPQHRMDYWYLRGMAEYRLGHREDALHYLALARELDEMESGPRLRAPQRDILRRALAELTPDAPLDHRPKRREGG